MNRLAAAAAILVLTLLNYFQFPGHTYLQSDTQIYVPILEHLWGPSTLRNEMLVVRPHVTFTFYDESAMALRKLTGWGFREVLEAQQLVFRGLGIWGIYLMATAAGLTLWPAVLVAAMVALGATIGGPSVLIFEYEPVPRSFAVPLLYLGTGLASHGRYLAAGTAGAAAFLIHPPSIWPFWGVFLVLAIWRRNWTGVLPLLCAAVLLFVSSRLQTGVGEAQDFFTRLYPLQEELQRMRASYVWVSMWWRNWWLHYIALWWLSVVAYWRLRRKTTVELKFFMIGLPLAGALSVPLSYVLLERVKWALMPQLQPLRALLFVTLIAVFSAAVAGCKAAQQKRFVEAFVWFALAYMVPTNTRLLALPSWNRTLVICVLAIAATFAIGAELRRHWAALAVAACAIGAFFLIPILGKVTNYPKLHLPEIAQLAAWAKTSTPKDAVFLFPDAGRELYPGIFRAEALRAVYVDWKGGGQVNYLKELGELWWQRWQQAMAEPLDPADSARFRALGIDYIVTLPKNRLPGERPAFENAGYAVYRLR